MKSTDQGASARPWEVGRAGVMMEHVDDAMRRRGAEPVALVAAALAAVMAIVYVWVIREQDGEVLGWVLGGLIGGAMLAGYGALRRARWRRVALLIAGIALTILGVLGVLSIGLPILVAGILAIVAVARGPGRDRRAATGQTQA